MIALVALALCLTISPTPVGGDELLPAGVINGALATRPGIYVVEEHRGLVAYVTQIRDQFAPKAELLVGEKATGEHSNTGIVVYGTPAGLPWLEGLSDSLPFHFDDDGLSLQGRRFTGEHLQLICALRHPANPELRMVLYTAQDPEDLVGINSIFHGPTEWLVADGGKTLAAGSFEVSRPLSSVEARRDLEYLVLKIAAVHPACVDGLPTAVVRRVKLAEERTSDSIARDRFWVEANAVVASLQDAHSSLAPSGRGVAFDLPLRWLREGLVAEFTAGDLQKGDLVQSVGGLDETQLLALLADRVPAETHWWLRARGPQLLATGFLSDAFELTGEGSLPVVVQRAGKQVALEIAPGTPRERRSRRPWISWEIDSESGLAVLTLDQCIFDDHYRRTLREFFEAVREDESQRVVVDLRRNGGGNSAVVDEFLRYLDLDEFVSYTGGVRESVDSLAQRSGVRELGYREFGRTVKRNERIANLPSFEGELSVLTSGSTFSSGSWFAVVVQDNGLGEIVGEPTGNAPSSYGDILRFTLPESGFAFTLSYKRWIRPNPEKDPAECLEPDVLVPLTRADVLAGVDPVLKFLVQRAQSKPR